MEGMWEGERERAFRRLVEAVVGEFMERLYNANWYPRILTIWSFLYRNEKNEPESRRQDHQDPAPQLAVSLLTSHLTFQLFDMKQQKVAKDLPVISLTEDFAPTLDLLKEGKELKEIPLEKLAVRVLMTTINRQQPNHTRSKRKRRQAYLGYS